MDIKIIIKAKKKCPRFSSVFIDHLISSSTVISLQPKLMKCRQNIYHMQTKNQVQGFAKLAGFWALNRHSHS